MPPNGGKLPNTNSNMSMTKIELNPLKGIHITEVGTLEFGMTANEVKEILGQPEQGEDFQLFYYSKELRLDFNSQKCLEFAEIISGPYPKNIEPVLYDINPFTLSANELVDLLAQKNGSDIDCSEAPECYAFRSISVGVFREFSEEDVQQSIKESKENGMYDDEKKWLLEDLEKSKHFWTVGIGIKDYYE